MTLSYLIQTMTDQRCKQYTEGRHWFPLWMFCSVRQVNGKLVISNRPY